MVSDVASMMMTQCQTVERPAESTNSGDQYRDTLKKLMESGKTDRPDRKTPDIPKKNAGAKDTQSKDSPEDTGNGIPDGVNAGFPFFFFQNMQMNPALWGQMHNVVSPEEGENQEQAVLGVMSQEEFAAEGIQTDLYAEADNAAPQSNGLPAADEDGRDVNGQPVDEMQPGTGTLEKTEKSNLSQMPVLTKTDAVDSGGKTEKKAEKPVQPLHADENEILKGQKSMTEQIPAQVNLTSETEPSPLQQTAAAETPEAQSAPPEIPESVQKLPQEILTKMAAGEKEFTVQLEPEHLGKLTIKAAFEDGKATVSIVCSNSKTLELLAGRAGEIGAILENNLGTPTNVLLDKTAPDYLNQGQEQAGQQDRRQEQEDGKKKNHDKEEGLDFLQQLRLGLV